MTKKEKTDYTGTSKIPFKSLDKYYSRNPGMKLEGIWISLKYHKVLFVALQHKGSNIRHECITNQCV